MKKLILSLVATVAAAGTLYAQSAPDALRFSQTNFGSTARFKSMGGAQIGVGGDMSSLGANPAGLGLFTKSEFSLTPEFNMVKGKANYLGQGTNSSKDQLNLNNVGVVFYSPTFKSPGQDAKKGVISAVFGVGYNRNNDFTANYNYIGTNANNSIVDQFAEIANQRVVAPDLLQNSIQRMAYDNYLLGYDAGAPTRPASYFATTRDNQGQVEKNQQNQSEIRTGSTSELNVAGALNISNEFYIGASIGFVNVRYINDKEFKESGYNLDENSNYDLSYRTSQEVSGSGVNGRLGVIFRPVSAFRIGATIQTPTWLYFKDDISFTLDTKIQSGPNANNYSNPPGYYGTTYRLRTPLKGSMGASYVIGNKALISADIDYIDYSTMRYSVDQDDIQGDIDFQNRQIKSFYKAAINYRVGAEYKVDNAFSLRAGYGNNGTAVKGDESNNFATKVYTGGLGYRFSNYYLDLAYQRVENNVELSPYLLNDETEPIANIKTARNNVFLTFGVRF